MMRKIFLIFFLFPSLLYPATFTVDRDPEFEGLDQGAVKTAVDEIEDEVNRYKLVSQLGSQRLMAESLANAAVESSYAGRLYSNWDQDYFLLSTGLRVAGQTSSLNGDEAVAIAESGDGNAGVGLSLVTLNFAVNGDKLVFFPLKNTILNFSLGTFETPKVEYQEGENLWIKNFTIGTGLSYKWYTNLYTNGWFDFNALMLTTGFYFSRTRFAMTDKEIFTETLTNSDGEKVELQMDNVFRVNAVSDSYVVPVDMVGSCTLVNHLNFFSGMGFDLATGRTVISADHDSTFSAVSADKESLEYECTSGGETSLANTETLAWPGVFGFKLITGLGVQLEAVRVDVPFVYYPSSGYSVAIVSGIVW